MRNAVCGKLWPFLIALHKISALLKGFPTILPHFVQTPLHKIRCLQKGVFPISCNGNYTMGGSGKTVGLVV